MEELLKAVKDALRQWDLSTVEDEDDLQDAMLNLQAVYDRVTGTKDYLQVPTAHT